MDGVVEQFHKDSYLFIVFIILLMWTKNINL